MMAKTAQSNLAEYEPEPRLGDFTVGPSNKLKLTECPLCALDPDRERNLFSSTDKPNVHFLKAHDADDVGRPMDELLAEMDFEARTATHERLAIDEALYLARKHVQERPIPSPGRRPYLYHFDRFLTNLLASSMGETRHNRRDAAGGDRRD